VGFTCGIVGLPNIGKSTIFNALTDAAAEAANYPFCTIEPNVGRVPVPDDRLDQLAEIASSKEIIPASMEFVDIAGLVEGASKGEGLGNQFLGHIRSVEAIAHVVRCFEDSDVTHVEGSVSPVRDIEVIETELMLADLGSVEKQLEKVRKSAKSGDKEAVELKERLDRAQQVLSEGELLLLHDTEELNFRGLGFITAKPMFFVANVGEEHASLSGTDQGKAEGALKELMGLASGRGLDLVVISGKVEEEIRQLPVEERGEFLKDLGLTESGLDRLARCGYKTLNLITFFTVGPKEAHAWTCAQGSLAPQGAGKIHTDFEKGFIRAEVISYEDYLAGKGEQGAKEAGSLRVEGKDYVVIDGDVVHFRFNV